MEYELRKTLSHTHKTQRKGEKNRIKTHKEIWKQITTNAKLNLNTFASRESGWGFCFVVFFYVN